MAKAEFQTRVQKIPAKGVPGDKAALNPCVYTDQNYVAGDSAIAAGRFAWGDPANPAGSSGEKSGALRALSSGAGAAQPLGLVERNLSGPNRDFLDGGTLRLPEGCALNIVKRGDLYAVSATVSVAGNKVFAVLADGSLKTGAAGASMPGALETAWTVTEGGAAGELITISNWSV